MALDRLLAGTHGQVRDALEARRGHVAEELGRIVTRIREDGSNAMVASDMGELDTHDLDTGLVELMNATLRRIDAALDRLAEGTYGRCTHCGHRIAEARLRAMPFAVRCHSCEAARERRTHIRSTWRRRLWDEGSNAGGEAPRER